MNTITKLVKNLRTGDVVVSNGYRRTVTRSPMACQAAGYVYVLTNREPINTFGTNEVQVEQGAPKAEAVQAAPTAPKASALVVGCPQCRASVGVSCRNPKGRTVSAHVRRVKLATKAATLGWQAS